MNKSSISNEGSQSSFSQSGAASSQQRYKKAIKEISKLVAMNSNIKKQLEEWKENYYKLEEEYQSLLLKHSEMMSKISQKTAQFGGSDHRNDELLIQMNKSDSQHDQILQSKVNPVQLNQTKIYEKFQDQRKSLYEKIQQYEMKINQKDSLINSLQNALEKKHSQLIQVEGRFGDLNQHHIALQNKYKGLKAQLQTPIPSTLTTPKNSTSFQNPEVQKYKRKIQDLQTKLQKAENWSKVVQSQYQQIRKSMIYTQSTMPSNLQNSIKIAGLNRISTQLDFSKKKSYRSRSKKKEEEQVNKIRKEYQQKKQKYKKQITQLRQQISEQNGRINYLNKFIEKQQFYIESYVDKNNGYGHGHGHGQGNQSINSGK